jgi:CRP-like cAMP-binding protein
VLRLVDAEDLDVLDLDAGDVFGVLDAPPGIDGAALVVAATDCEVVRIPPDAAGRAISAAPDLATVLEQIAVTRRRRIDRVLRRASRDSTGGAAITEAATGDDDS